MRLADEGTEESYTGVRATIHRLWYGRTDMRPRAIWRTLVPLAISVVVVVLVQRGITALNPPGTITELGLPILVGLASMVTAAVKLSDRSISEIGLKMDSAWLWDLVAGILLGVVFQLTVTSVWAGIGGLTVTDTAVWGVAAQDLSLTVIIGVTLVGVLVRVSFEEFIFRSLLIRNVAEGFAAKGVSRSHALGGAVLLAGLLFTIPHAFSVSASVTNPAFGALQALASVSYFVVAYAATGQLALPIGIHFASNAWLKLVVGTTGSPYPKLVAAERTVGGVVDILLLFVPALLLIGLILAWARVTGRTNQSIDDAYRRVVN